MSIDTTLEKDLFWTKDISVLFDRKRLVEFVPSQDMTYEEKLNALMRFFIYSSIVLILYLRDWWTMYIPLLGALFTIFLFKTSKEKRETPMEYKPEDTYKLPVDSITPSHCTVPTKSNPFMNVMFQEWTDNPNRPPACENKGINQTIDKYFNYNLYKDVDDVFDKNNSQRQFYTTPITTIPNDQGSFARWLYSVPSTCKEDSEGCLIYEPLQGTRPTFGDPEYLT